MDITHNLKKITTRALVSGAVAVAFWGRQQPLPRQTLSLKAHFSGARGNRCRGHACLGSGANLPKIRGRRLMWCGTTACATRIGRQPYGRGNVRMSDGAVSEIWDGPDPPPYFQPVCAPFVPPVNCRPQNG